MKKIRNKKFTSIVLSSILVATLCFGVTIAYLQDQTSTLTNSFDIGSIHTDIGEDTNGTDLTKKPYVINKDKTDVLVRMRLTISNVESFTKYFGLEGIDTQSNSNWVCSNSEQKYNTYYYYNDVLKGDLDLSDEEKVTTTPLFTKILIKEGTGFREAEIPGDKEILKHLEESEITIYQESIPTVAYINGQEINAVNADGELIPDKVRQLWNYFDNITN